mmetsp:Transcript_5051/g.7411  ORF Transcript_5051/g.7411 Transcript_5051/m.7411 type:complete len:231 (+) Transcript_5051:761-1453(+)
MRPAFSPSDLDSWSSNTLGRISELSMPNARWRLASSCRITFGSPPARATLLSNSKSKSQSGCCKSLDKSTSSHAEIARSRSDRKLSSSPVSRRTFAYALMYGGQCMNELCLDKPSSKILAATSRKPFIRSSMCACAAKTCHVIIPTFAPAGVANFFGIVAFTTKGFSDSYVSPSFSPSAAAPPCCAVAAASTTPFTLSASGDKRHLRARENIFLAALTPFILRTTRCNKI